MTTPTHRLTSLNLDEVIPQAAWLLDGFRYITVR
jgi:hypothetical protein